MARSKARTFESEIWQPLSAGPLDNRSTPSLMPAQSYRLRQNWYSSDENKLCRSYGWRKLLHKDSGYSNEDLHDQLLALQTYFDPDPAATTPGSEITAWPNAACTGAVKTRATGRQPISLLFPATSTFGNRMLFAATESRIYALNTSTRNWRIIGDGFGLGTSLDCPKRRFQASLNRDAVFFTNDYNQPVYHLIDQPTFGCDMQAVSVIPDLELIGVSKAACTWTWRKCTWFANCEVDGQRRANRLYWSDAEDPLSFDPAKAESISGFKDLEYGEEIMGAVEMSGYLLIFTNQRIWQVTVVGGEDPFRFDKRYNPDKSGESCLFYKNTLVSTGDEIAYLGHDGIYRYDLTIPKPERTEWAHRASGEMFARIDPACCDNHFGVYVPELKSVFFYYAEKDSGSCCPNKTLVLNVRNGVASTMDTGMTAACVWQPDIIKSVREWIIENCICTAAQMDAMGYSYVKQGLPLTEAIATCTPVTSIYTNQPLVVGDATVEDYNKATADAESLCERLVGVRAEDLCVKCPTSPIFIGAWAEDWCLKEIGFVYYREKCTNPTGTGVVGDASKPWSSYTSSVGQYSQEGYETILRSGPQSHGDPTSEKIIEALNPDFLAELQTTPNKLFLRIGISAQPVDPNADSGCQIYWMEEEPIDLSCQTVDLETHLEDGTRPDEVPGWKLWAQGYCIYFELKITGTGGGACFSKLEQSIARIGIGRNY